MVSIAKKGSNNINILKYVIWLYVSFMAHKQKFFNPFLTNTIINRNNCGVMVFKLNDNCYH